MAEPLSLGSLLGNALGSRGLVLRGHGVWETRLLTATLDDIRDLQPVPPRVHLMVTSQQRIVTDPRLAGRLVLLSLALQASEVGLATACYMQLPIEWYEALEADHVPRQLQSLLACYSTEAYGLFDRDFCVFVNVYGGHDLTQLEGPIAKLAAVAQLAALCAGSAYPLAAEGCSLLAELLRYNTAACSEPDVWMGWTQDWARKVGVWQANCNPTHLKRARLDVLYNYLQGARTVWALQSAKRRSPAPSVAPGAIDMLPVAPTLADQLKFARHRLADLDRACNDAERLFLGRLSSP